MQRLRNHEDHRTHHRGRGHRSLHRGLAGRGAQRSPHAVERRWQLHQHALAAGELSDSVPDHRHDARRVSGVQSVASLDGPGDARRA